MGMTTHTAKKNPIIRQVTTMLATSENILFPGHNHQLTTSTDDPTLWLFTHKATWVKLLCSQSRTPITPIVIMME